MKVLGFVTFLLFIFNFSYAQDLPGELRDQARELPTLDELHPLPDQKDKEDSLNFFDGHHYKIFIKNNCHETIYLALHAMKPGAHKSWITKGWYKFEPGEKGWIIKSPHKHWYFTAKSAHYNWHGPNKFPVRNDGKKRFKHMRMNHRGDVNHRLTCGN